SAGQNRYRSCFAASGALVGGVTVLHEILTVTGDRSGLTIPVMNSGPIANSGGGSDARNTRALANGGTRPMMMKISTTISQPRECRLIARLFEGTPAVYMRTFERRLCRRNRFLGEAGRSERRPSEGGRSPPSEHQRTIASAPRLGSAPPQRTP